jgi:hypothetical protein
LEVSVERAQRWLKRKQVTREQWPGEARVALASALSRISAVLQLRRTTLADAWAGALVCVVVYSLLVSRASSPQAFFWTFFIWLSGSAIIHLVFRLLGSSQTQSNVLIAVAYSIAPLTILEPLMTMTEAPLPGLALVVKCVAVRCRSARLANPAAARLHQVLWASRSASMCLVTTNVDHEKKTLLFVLPLVLLNIYFLSLRAM